MSEMPRDEREEVIPEQEVPSGEYRYVRPAGGEHYTDAQYIPRDQAPNTPRHYTYGGEDMPPRQNPAQSKKRRRRVGLMGALCLVCLLLGAAAGVVGASQWENWFVRDMEDTLPMEITPAPTAAPTPVPTAVPQTNGAVMDPSLIYDMACTQVVGITSVPSGL